MGNRVIGDFEGEDFEIGGEEENIALVSNKADNKNGNLEKGTNSESEQSIVRPFYQGKNVG